MSSSQACAPRWNGNPGPRAAALAGALLACSAPALTARAPVSSAPSSAPSAPRAEAAAQTPSASAATQTLPFSDLVVGSERGLEIWSTKGKLERRVVAGPALHPRWLDSGAVLVLVPAKPGTLSHGAELQRITLADGKRTTLAQLPTFSCTEKGEAPGNEPDEYDVDLQDESEFEIDPAQGAACLRLQDRNDNMVSLALSVRVDLASHKVERWLALGEDVCQPPADVHPPPPQDENGSSEPQGWCVLSSLRQYALPKPSASRPFDLSEEGQVRERTPQGWRNVLHIAGYSAELASPSGRWLVLGGDQSDGDYIHRSLVLLDRDRGQVYPIVTGDWPEPLQPKGKAHPQLATPIEGTMPAVGETEVRWIGTAEAEVLIVDGFALRPGVGGFEFDGQLVR
ncbi:MAG: hypothetical protein ABI895_09710 [Deltaproteobacteria bacterium]